MASSSFPCPQEVADSTFFITGPASNWVLLREGNDFTVVDGGYPADTPAVLSGIRHLGLDPAKAAAMILTHSHIDHTGAAEWFASAGVPVLSGAAEVNAVKGTDKFQVAPREILRRAWRPRVMKWTWHVYRAGGLKNNNIPSAAALDIRTLPSLPGAPRAVPTPGHSPGHTAYYLPASRTLISGDALISGHGMSSCRGPQMLPPMFHHDLDGAYGALNVLASIDADVILPGHGSPMNLSAAQAAAAAHARR